MSTVDYNEAISKCPNAPHDQLPFRYCPSCPWTEAHDAPQCSATILQKDMRFSMRSQCESYEGHAGDHYVTMDACEPVGQLTWSGEQEVRRDG